MIRARHSQIHRHVFRLYLQRLLSKHFTSVTLINALPALPASMPIILVPNHGTWWDGFLTWYLNEQVFERKFYLMMLEEELRKYMFFSRLGAFSIKRDSAATMLPSLRYVTQILDSAAQPQVLLTLFPQGELLPPNIRPLGFKRGLDWILRQLNQPVAVLPLAIRLEFLGEQRPGAFLRFGTLQTVAPGGGIEMPQLEALLTENLDAAGADIVAGTQYRVLHHGQRSINRRVDSMRGNTSAAAD